MKESKMVAPKEDKMDEYELEECVRTLIKAEEIKADEKKMKLVQAHLDKKKRAISSIAGLKKRAADMDKDDDDY